MRLREWRGWGRHVSLTVIYAKKMRLPTQSANVTQALNMALAFEAAGAAVRCFPGVTVEKGRSTARDVLRRVLEDIGAHAVPPGWRILPGKSKGLYGLLFRLALFGAMRASPDGLLFARDIAEAEYLIALGRVVRRPLMYEAHEILHQMHEKEGKGHWQNTLRREKRVFASLAGLVCLNSLVLEQARDVLGYDGPACLAPNGYNPSAFYPLPLFTPENPWPDQSSPVTAVYVGNFHSGKGVEELLDAFALLPGRFHLRIIGGSPVHLFAALKEKAVTLGLPDRVTFTGALPQNRIREACTGAHLFVIPQQSSFFFSPLKLYEAMALGLPIVCTPLSVFTPYIASECVLTAADATAAGLARAIEVLAGQRGQAEALRQKGLAEAAGHSWTQRASNILDFISSLEKR